MKRRQAFALAIALLFVVAAFLSGTAWAQGDDDEPNVGLLRVYDVSHPRQVPPSAKVAFTIDVEYGIRTNATIRSAMFEGSLGRLGEELWQSDEEAVSGGGDRIWNVTLTAPSSEQEWNLVVFAYYLEAAVWKYYPTTETFRGPGVVGTKIKVAALATLEIDLGAPNIPIKLDGETATTSALGSVIIRLPVGGTHQIAVESIVSIDDSTRLVFEGWEDGTNATQRSLLFDGDSKISGAYKEQYLLRVNSPISAYSYSEWYDPGTEVTLSADSVVPMSGIPGALGLRYVFNGWSGDLASNANMINLTMDQPKAIHADFAIDYTPTVIPAILAAGVVGAAVLVALRVRSKPEPPPSEKEVGEEVAATKFCDGCGEPVEESWEHCTHCGKALRPSESAGN